MSKILIPNTCKYSHKIIRLWWLTNTYSELILNNLRFEDDVLFCLF
jgi:hypothetical protein